MKTFTAYTNMVVIVLLILFTNNYPCSGFTPLQHSHATCIAPGYTEPLNPPPDLGDQPFVGTLTGTVRSCYNNAPLAGVMVTCGIYIATTNAAGQFTIVNIAAGTYTVTYSLAGFLNVSCQVTIVNNQNTVCPCSCMNPITAIVSGICTNIVTGAPEQGVLVQIGTVSALSLANGFYTLSIYPSGSYLVTVSKLCFNTFTLAGLTLITGNSYTQNFWMVPTMNAPTGVSAMLNTGQTAVNISWSPPVCNYRVMYDDGVPESCINWATAGNMNAVKFTPNGYPATITEARFNLCNGSPAGSNIIVPFSVNIYKDDGPGGLPGTLLAGPIMATPIVGWKNVTIPVPVNITSGSFYIAMVQGGDYPNCMSLSVDTTTSQLRSYQKYVTGSGPWTPANGNFMIQATLLGPNGAMPDSYYTYKVYRLKQGQESTPGVWTLLGTTTPGVTSFTDNGWPGLSCSPWRWAIQANYNTYFSPYSFSNVIGKCYTANLTFHGTKCCPNWPDQRMIIKAQNLDILDTGYYIQTDSTGLGHRNNMWNGHYKFSADIFGCQHYEMLATIHSDTTITITMPSGVTPPPINLQVNNKTLMATWSPPKYSVNLLDETWGSGNFTLNGWTVSGGTNWQIAAGFGNPSPCARFNWTPQVTNYSQYLTSRSLNPVDAPIVTVQFDLFLSNYSNNTVNSLALEVWNGTTWAGARFFDNSNGNIPWTSISVDISVMVPPSAPFKIRFHAYGDDSQDINYWQIDNIKVISSTPYDSANCLLGYNPYLNNIQAAFVTDTFYQIPPGQVLYGHPYTFCVVAAYGYNIPGQSTPVCCNFTSKFLYPPSNLVVDTLDCATYLEFNKPWDPATALAPLGLMGYNVNRNAANVHYLPSPDSTFYYDLNLNPGNYSYMVQAKYDLTPYGFSGQVDSSTWSNQVSVVVNCGDNLPFIEGWNSGGFTYNGWTFSPGQGNWGVNTGLGNPSPCAGFSWTNSKRLITNYSFSMISPNINTSPWTCANLWLDFDLKLVDRNATANEKLAVDLWYANSWHQVAEYANEGSFDWTTKHININVVHPNATKIRFRAHGANSFDILHWYLDNIQVYGDCMPPVNLSISQSGNLNTLTWMVPQCVAKLSGFESDSSILVGYNVFRTGKYGVGPYTKMNISPVVATTFVDTLPPLPGGAGVYVYCVDAVYIDATTNNFLCASPCSDTVSVFYPAVGIIEGTNSRISIYPNPATELINVKSDLPLKRIELFNLFGEMIFIRNFEGATSAAIRTADFSDGVYMIKITTDKGTVIRKGSVMN